MNPAGTLGYQPVDPRTLGKLRILTIGDIELHVDGHRLVVRGKPVYLPHQEFLILRQIMDNAGRVESGPSAELALSSTCRAPIDAVGQTSADPGLAAN
jgi:hypothetical protein